MRRPLYVFATAALLLSACGNSSSSSRAVNATSTTDVALTDFMITPMAINSEAGSLKFHVHNDGQSPHNFTITKDGKVLGASKDLNPGQSDDMTVEVASGTYDTICSEPGHESLGMKGTLLAH